VKELTVRKMQLIYFYTFLTVCIFLFFNDVVPCCLFCVFVCLFYLYPPVEKATGGAVLWTNPHSLKSCSFSSFPVVSLFDLLTTEIAACSKRPNRDNHRKAPYLRTQQCVRWECEWTYHAIVITRSP